MKIKKMTVKELFSRAIWEIKKYLYKKKESNTGADYRYTHVTYYAIGNAGDTVLSQCVRREFERSGRNLGWNILRVNRPVNKITVNAINRTKALVIGGGGLFLPDTNKNDISGWQWAVSSELLHEIEVPIIVYSVGYNYFPGQIPNNLFISNLISLCEKASFIGLRNHGSIEAIKKLLPEDLIAKITYQPCTTTIIRKIYGDKIPAKRETGRIAFNVAFDRAESRFGADMDLICNEIALAAKELESHGYKIVIVSHCDVDEGILPFMAACGVKAEVINLSHAFPDEVYRFYNEIDCVLGMRGHAQMIPFGLNCRIITLGSHDKMRWFLEDVNATDWYIDLVSNKECLCSVICSKFYEIMKDGKRTDKRIKEAQNRLWNITQHNLSQIEKMIHIETREEQLN